MNVQVTKMAATSPKVTHMLEDAVNFFTRNIHFLHPDYPEDKKKPIFDEELDATQYKPSVSQ